MNQSQKTQDPSHNMDTMLATIRPHISAEQLQRIEAKMQAWEKATTVAPAAPSSSVDKKAMPPLVMRTKGLPRSLDPLYFTLKETR